MGIKSLFIKYKRIIIYAVVGCINTLVDMAVYYLLVILTAIPLGGAQAIGYSCGVLCSFILNRTVTFKDRDGGKLYVQIFRFLIVNGVSLLVSVYGIQLLTALFDSKYWAKPVVTIVTMLINYIGYNLIVFNKKKGNHTDQEGDVR